LRKHISSYENGNRKTGDTMSKETRTVQVQTTSQQSVEEAMAWSLEEVRAVLNELRETWPQDGNQRVNVLAGEVESYQVNYHVTFVLEDAEPAETTPAAGKARAVGQ
jgi:flavin-binding protein dodecin